MEDFLRKALSVILLSSISYKVVNIKVIMQSCQNAIQQQSECKGFKLDLSYMKIIVSRRFEMEVKFLYLICLGDFTLE